MQIHTIGHSTRTFEVFLAFLNEHRIKLLIDVRRWPASRRMPHFNRENLCSALESHEIDYLWQKDLGGFRKAAPDSPNTAWRVASFRAYADFMLTAEFAVIIEQLEPIVTKQSAALMCAEAVPWRCHRQLLATHFSCAAGMFGTSWTMVVIRINYRPMRNPKEHEFTIADCCKRN